MAFSPHSKLPEYNISTVFKNPSQVEKKGLYLEETLENMQAHRKSVAYKLFKMKQGKAPKEDLKPLQTKLDNLDAGIKEVFDKCDKLWKGEPHAV